MAPDYVVRRLVMFVPTLLGASILIFVLLRLVPGDIAEILVYQSGSESSAIQQQQVKQLRTELGLDRPVAVQYVDWIGNALRGDFGQSYLQRRPVGDILRERVCAIGSWAVPSGPWAGRCPSLAGYVTVTGTTDRATAAGRC